MAELIRRKDARAKMRMETLPGPDGPFRVLTFPILEETGVVRHLFSTREGGVSEGCFAAMNYDTRHGDDPAKVRENFRRTAEAMGTSPERTVCTQQTHTVNVRRVGEAEAGMGVLRPRDYSDTDGLITDTPGLLLAAFGADCATLFFVDPVRRAIGLAHSGRRGTVRRMGRQVAEAMTEAFGTRPEDLVCAIGPSICRDCYEVGPEVADEFRAAFSLEEKDIGPIPEKAAIPAGDGPILCRSQRPGKYQLDLWAANRRVLIEAGVRPERIAVTDVCTCCNPELMFSHRRMGWNRGVQGAFLMLEPESGRCRPR